MTIITPSNNIPFSFGPGGYTATDSDAIRFRFGLRPVFNQTSELKSIISAFDKVYTDLNIRIRVTSTNNIITLPGYAKTNYRQIADLTNMMTINVPTIDNLRGYVNTGVLWPDTSNIQSLINATQLYKDSTYTYLKGCPTVVIGYTNNGIRTLKLPCVYGGIRDIGTSLYGQLYARDLTGSLRVFQVRSFSSYLHSTVRKYSDISNSIRGYGKDSVTLTNILKGVSVGNKSEIYSYIKQTWPQESNIYSYLKDNIEQYSEFNIILKSWALKVPRNLGILLKGWVIEDSLDIYSYIKQTWQQEHNIYSYLKDNIEQSLNLYANLHGWQEAQLTGLLIPAYERNLPGNLRVFDTNNLVSHLLTIVPENISSTIHSWDYMQLPQSIYGIYGPYDIQSGIQSIEPKNIRSIISGFKGIEYFNDLSSRVTSYYLSNIYSIIYTIGHVDLSSILIPYGSSKDLPSGAYPKVISVRSYVSIALLDHSNLLGYINQGCFGTGFKDLYSKLKVQYARNLRSAIFTKRGGNIQDIKSYVNSENYIVQDTMSIIVPRNMHKTINLPVKFSITAPIYVEDKLNINLSYIDTTQDTLHIPFLNGYLKRIKVTVDASKIDEGLTHFPVTVFLSDTKGAAVFYELGSYDNRDKIAFTTSDGITQLYAECEEFDVINRKAVFHVSKFDWQLSSEINTNFYLYYDVTADHNTNYISNVGSDPAQQVWDSNFKAVYHMCQLPPATILDSTSNNYHMIPFNMDSSDLVDGINSKALDFDGANDYLRSVDELNLFEGGDEYTMSVMLSPDSFGFEYLSQYGPSSIQDDSFINGVNTSGNTRHYAIDGSGNVGSATSINSITLGDWYLITSLKNRPYVSTYINGEIENESTFDRGTMNNVEYVSIGARMNTLPTGGVGSFTDGKISEVRISNVARTNTWISVTYDALFDNLLSYKEEKLYSTYNITSTITVYIPKADLSSTIQAAADTSYVVNDNRPVSHKGNINQTVIKLTRGNEDWRREVEILFRDSVKDYYYLSHANKVAKYEDTSKWSFIVTGFNRVVDGEFDREKIRSHYLVDLRNHTTVDSALRDLIDRVTMYRESNLGTYINASGGFKNLRSRVNYISRYKSYRNFPTYVTPSVRSLKEFTSYIRGPYTSTDVLSEFISGVSRNNIANFSSSLTVVTPALRAGLLGEWLFNGNADDTSGNFNHGIVTGATLVIDSDGNPNSAYDFDSDHDGVSVLNSQSFPTEGTIALKFIPQSWLSENNIFSNNSGGSSELSTFRFEQDRPTKGIFHMSNSSGSTSSVTSNIDFADGTTYTLVLTWSTINNRMTIYVDGAYDNTISTTVYTPSTFNNFNLGRGIYSPGRDFYGQIDWTKMWERELTSSEAISVTEAPY